MPNLGASSAVVAVLGAFVVLYPSARIRTVSGCSRTWAVLAFGDLVTAKLLGARRILPQSTMPPSALAPS